MRFRVNPKPFGRLTGEHVEQKRENAAIFLCYYPNLEGKAESYCVSNIQTVLQPSSTLNFREIMAPLSLFLIWFHTSSESDSDFVEPRGFRSVRRQNPTVTDTKTHVFASVCAWVSERARLSKANYTDKRGIKETPNKWRLFVFAG